MWKLEGGREGGREGREGRKGGRKRRGREGGRERGREGGREGGRGGREGGREGERERERKDRGFPHVGQLLDGLFHALESPIDDVYAVGSRICHMLCDEAAKARQVGGDGGNTHHCALGWGCEGVGV